MGLEGRLRQCERRGISSSPYFGLYQHPIYASKAPGANKGQLFLPPWSVSQLARGDLSPDSSPSLLAPFEMKIDASHESLQFPQELRGALRCFTQQGYWTQTFDNLFDGKYGKKKSAALLALSDAMLSRSKVSKHWKSS